MKIQIGSPLVELFGESSAESPFVPLKCIIPTLNASERKKKTFTPIFDLPCSFYCINFFATTPVDCEQRKVLLNLRCRSILYRQTGLRFQNEKFGRANVQIFLVSKNEMIMCGLSLTRNY